MKRADRRNSSDDNSLNNPRSRQPEPVSSHELKSLLATARAQRDEFRQRVEETEGQIKQAHQQYLIEQQKHQTMFTLYREEQQKYQTTFTLYQEAQTQAQSYLTLYNQEQTRNSELLVKYETVLSERNHYLTLYNEAQDQLKLERRSKAGIKGWETRRKRENERLKQEIGEMTVLLRDSLARKDEAINNLEALAERMDRIQYLVDSVEGESINNPANFLQKITRIWQAIKDILAE